MATVKALKSFCGKVSMFKSEVRDLTDPALVKDLERAGYIEVAEKPQSGKKAKKSEETEE